MCGILKRDMPLLVAQRNTHGVVALDRSHSANNKIDQQPLDFTMSKYRPSNRHQLYRQIYGGADDALQYEKNEDQGEFLYTFFFIHSISTKIQYFC